MFMLLSTAFALDCTGLTTETCNALNAMEVAIESTEGDLINVSGPGRFNPNNLYNRLENLRLALGDDGCRVDYSFDGWDAGTFGHGNFSGDWGSGSGAGTSGGTFANKSVDGGYGGGGAVGSIGDVFGKYNKAGQIAANRDAGFDVGYWVRIAGKRGIYLTLTGDCDAGVQENEALDPWFQGTLPAAPPAPQNITFRGTVDNVMTLYVDGANVSIPGASSWPTAGQVVVPLTSGDHLVAVRGVDGGPPSMFQMVVTDEGGTALMFTDTNQFVSLNAAPSEPAGWNTDINFDDSTWNIPTSCGVAPAGPWGDPVNNLFVSDTFIWDGGHCSTSGTRLFRGILTVP